MKVDFNKSVTDFYGKPLIDNGSVKTIKEVVCSRLYLGGDGLSSDEKYQAYKTMTKIAAADGAVDIEDKESILIKKVCESSLTVGAYGQIVDLLNGN